MATSNLVSINAIRVGQLCTAVSIFNYSLSVDYRLNDECKVFIGLFAILV